MAAPIPVDSQVSWQCAFWILVPCAINTMTQPSGRICGLPEQYRIYLRSSPIFCAIDALALIVRLVIYLVGGQSFRNALLLVRAVRFDDDQAISFEGGFQALEKLTWVRWLLFSLGTLPQVIKLLALQGVPWTKAWAVMFFSSFLVVEMFSAVLYLSCSSSRLSLLNRLRKSCSLSQSIIFKALFLIDTENTFRADEAEAENLSNRPQEGHQHIQPDNATTANGNTAVSQLNTPDQADPSQSQAPCIIMPDSELPTIPEGAFDTLHEVLSLLDKISAGLAFLLHWILLIWAYHQIAQPVFNLNYLANKPSWFISVYHPGWLFLSMLFAAIIYGIVFSIIYLILFLAFSIVFVMLRFILLRRPLLQKRLTESALDAENLAYTLLYTIDSWTARKRSDDGSITLWDPTTTLKWFPARNSSIKSPSAVMYSPKGRLLAMAPSGNNILLWNPALHKKVQRLHGHSELVLAVAFSCDSRQIASASADHTVMVWNVGTKNHIHKLEGHGSSVTAITFSYDNTLLASASADKTIALWSPASGLQLRRFQAHNSSILAVAFSHNNQLLASVPDGNIVMLWNPANGTLLRTLGRHIYRLWTPLTCREVQECEGHSRRVRAIAFSSDNKFLASASDDCTISLWNYATWGEIYKLEGHDDSIRAVAFSHDNRLLASASNDKTVILWSTVTGEKLREFWGHKSPVVAVSFSRDGQLLVSVSDDKVMRIWNVVTAESVIAKDEPTPVGRFAPLLPCILWLHTHIPFYEGDVKGGLVWEFIVLIVSLRFFTRIIWFATEKQPLRRKVGLQGGHRGADKRALEEDHFAVGCFVTFLLSVLCCFLWYCFRYDSTGSYKPGWTDIFG